MNTAELASRVEHPGGDLLVVVGPTASGKTALAIELARRLDGEVIGVDSVQIYRRFDIGSGKPTASEVGAVPYHLIDCADAHAPLNAGSFAAMAHEVIGQIRERGRVPILCGGSFLWVKAILGGLIEVAGSSPEIRQRHEDEAREHGRAALHARLTAIDPVMAAQINPNNLIRVSRALEVWELTGERMSDLQARHKEQKPRYAHRLVGIRWPREVLFQRIAARTSHWLATGWLDEVRALRDDGYGATRAMGSVGYKQALEHLEGRLPRRQLDEAINQVTRVFVRRQMTWLRDEPVCWLEPHPPAPSPGLGRGGDAEGAEGGVSGVLEAGRPLGRHFRLPGATPSRLEGCRQAFQAAGLPSPEAGRGAGGEAFSPRGSATARSGRRRRPWPRSWTRGPRSWPPGRSGSASSWRC